MENETRGYIFAWSHSLIHYLKISVKRQKIESRIRGNSPKFNNIKLICFIFFYFIYGFERVWACLLCNVCLRSYIFLAQRQSVRLYLFHVPCIPIQSLAFLQPCVTVWRSLPLCGLGVEEEEQPLVIHTNQNEPCHILHYQNLGTENVICVKSLWTSNKALGTITSAVFWRNVFEALLLPFPVCRCCATLGRRAAMLRLVHAQWVGM